MNLAMKIERAKMIHCLKQLQCIQDTLILAGRYDLLSPSIGETITKLKEELFILEEKND